MSTTSSTAIMRGVGDALQLQGGSNGPGRGERIAEAQALSRDTGARWLAIPGGAFGGFLIGGSLGSALGGVRGAQVGVAAGVLAGAVAGPTIAGLLILAARDHAGGGARTGAGAAAGGPDADPSRDPGRSGRSRDDSHSVAGPTTITIAMGIAGAAALSIAAARAHLRPSVIVLGGLYGLAAGAGIGTLVTSTPDR